MTENILNSINIVIEKIYKSIEENIYDTLDGLINISSNLFNQEPLKYIFNENDKYGIMFIATSLILFFVVQYLILRIVSMYNGSCSENIFKFIFKVIIIVILASNSRYICQTILDINESFTNIISGLGKDITGQDISFCSFKEIINDLEKYMGNDNISIDGLIKGFISFGCVTLLINYAVRYVTVIFLIILMPFAIMFYISDYTRGIFYAWIKLCIINICQQWIVKLLLIIPISFRNVNDQIFKIIIVGTIYLLYKINLFTREILGTIVSYKRQRE